MWLCFSTLDLNIRMGCVLSTRVHHQAQQRCFAITNGVLDTNEGSVDELLVFVIEMRWGSVWLHILHEHITQDGSRF